MDGEARSLPCEGEPERMRFASRADSFGRTQQDDWRAIARAESKRGGEGWSQRTQKLEIAELNPQRASSSRDFLCRIWYLCWNLTKHRGAGIELVIKIGTNYLGMRQVFL
jgi:hypothetical protein